MREVIRRHADIGADQIKLSMSGEEVKTSQPRFRFPANITRSQKFGQPRTATSLTRKQLRVSMKLTDLGKGFVHMLELVIP